MKSTPEDFIVDEMLADGSFASERIERKGDGAFVWVAVRKVNWNTIDLAREIAHMCRTSENRVNYGGIKDRVATAYQVFSVNTREGIEVVKEKIGKIRDVEVISGWRENRWIKNEDFVGNKFTIILRECDFSASSIPLQKIFQNYFGEQRFGSVYGNSHLVGFHLLRGDYGGAVREYFAGVERGEAAAGRREKEMHKRSLVQGPENFVKNNWRVFRLCVNAAQSYLFNEELRMRVREGEAGVLEGEYSCGRNRFGFADVNCEGGEFTVAQLVGSECKTFNKYKRELMEKYGLRTDDFARVGVKGGWRTLYAPVLGLEAHDIGRETICISFKLQKGSYATVLVKELLGEEFSI